MNKKTADTELRARRNVAKLRTIKGMEKLADSFERLMNGARAGGAARAKKLSKKRRKEIATNAANARWRKK
jgi:transcriptional regulator of met regulon